MNFNFTQGYAIEMLVEWYMQVAKVIVYCTYYVSA